MTNIINMMCCNCKGVMSAVTYLCKCPQTHKFDICALSEHWLRQCNLHFLQNMDYIQNFKTYAKSVDECAPQNLRCSNYRKGVALLVSIRIERYVVREIEVNSDRIIGIEIQLPNFENLFIFAVYLPAASVSIENFRENVDIMHEIYSSYTLDGEVIFLGDFNTKIKGPRFDVTLDDRGRYLNTVLNELGLSP